MRRILIATITVAVLSLVACKALPQTIHEKAFYAKQDVLFKKASRDLIASGHAYSDEGPMMIEMEAGEYSWHQGICDYDGKPSPCRFGAYTFSQRALNQAMRSYFLYAQMEGGTDILVDVGQGVFDPEIVGYGVEYLTYCQLTGGKLRHCDSGEDSGFEGAKVVEFIDKFHVRLDKKAKWDAQMHHLAIRPRDYIDLCACTVGGNK